MNAIATRAGKDIQEMAAILATFPEPGKWTQDQRAQAVNFAALLETAQKMIAVKNLAGIDIGAEKTIFLENAGRTASEHTRRAYGAGLDRLEAWARARGVNLLELSPMQADDFIYSLRGDRAAASIRLDTAAASSFYTWLHRRHTAIENPFRGSKARPAKKAVKKIDAPQTAAEVKAIIKGLPADLAAAAAVMAYRGLRAGALETMTITGNTFKAYSKGKDIAGELPAAALDAVKAAGLPLRGAFSGIKANTLEKRIARAIAKLYKQGKVKAAYSCHDLRHFYAITEYRKDKDIYRLCGLLDHASIQITENYLRTLGVVKQ